jgi:hypothetical protein
MRTMRRSAGAPTREEAFVPTTVTNKTRKPLSVPLPRGKTLHLGPLKSGQIATSDAEHPGVKALVDSGVIEISIDGGAHSDRPGGGTQGRPAHGYASSGGPRRSGDR